jgi:hypothetical protein
MTLCSTPITTKVSMLTYLTVTKIRFPHTMRYKSIYGEKGIEMSLHSAVLATLWIKVIVPKQRTSKVSK